MPSKKKFKIFLQILGPLIFVYILTKIDYNLLLKEVKLFKWHFLIFALGLMVLEIIIRTLRWQIVLSSLDISLSFKEGIALHWLGLFIANITPGHLGEVIKVYFLKNKGYSAFRSLFSIVLDRIADISVLLFFGLLIFIFFLESIGLYILIIGIFLVAGIIFVCLLLNQKSFIHKFFSKIIQKIFSVDFNKYGRLSLNRFWQGIKKLKKEAIVAFLSYLTISWFLYFLCRYVIAQALGLPLTFIDIIIISTVVAIVCILPISIAGIGTREATMIYLFSFFGLNKEVAVLFALLISAINIISVSFGLIPYLKESALINKIKKQDL